jgi:hypothetical protein
MMQKQDDQHDGGLSSSTHCGGVQCCLRLLLPLTAKTFNQISESAGTLTELATTPGDPWVHMACTGSAFVHVMCDSTA